MLTFAEQLKMAINPNWSMDIDAVIDVLDGVINNSSELDWNQVRQGQNEVYIARGNMLESNVERGRSRQFVTNDQREVGKHPVNILESPRFRLISVRSGSTPEEEVDEDGEYFAPEPEDPELIPIYTPWCWQRYTFKEHTEDYEGEKTYSISSGKIAWLPSAPWDMSPDDMICEAYLPNVYYSPPFGPHTICMGNVPKVIVEKEYRNDKKVGQFLYENYWNSVFNYDLRFNERHVDFPLMRSRLNHKYKNVGEYDVVIGQDLPLICKTEQDAATLEDVVKSSSTLVNSMRAERNAKLDRKLDECTSRGILERNEDGSYRPAIGIEFDYGNEACTELVRAIIEYVIPLCFTVENFGTQIRLSHSYLTDHYIEDAALQ